MDINLKENLGIANKPEIKPNQSNITKDSINSISTETSSNYNNISSLSNYDNMKKDSNNNYKSIFNINFNSKEEYLKYNGDYINELYSNLLEEEKNLVSKPKYGYMQFQKDINEKIRAILVDWIIVVHDKFHLQSQTLYQSIWLIRRYKENMYPPAR